MILQLKGIKKSFGATLAVDGVDFELKKGEVHALLGENGAGKTTLMNLIYGLYQPDSGEIYVDGKKVKIDSPKTARFLGIGMVHQHFMLVPTLSVAENLAIAESKSWGIFKRKEAERKTNEFSKKFSLNVEADVKVWQLSVGIQQRVEILKALISAGKILILDEPTAVLTPLEVDELFDILKKLKADGHSIIFISHKLKEVMQISDRISVMRNGRHMITAQTDSISPSELAHHMVGREIEALRAEGGGRRAERIVGAQHAAPNSGEMICRGEPPCSPYGQRESEVKPLLEVKSLFVYGDRDKLSLNGISFKVNSGEILGIAGVDGNGQSELAEALVGLRKIHSGEIKLSGKTLVDLSPLKARQAGIAYIPQDRQQVGLILPFSVKENLILDAARLKNFRRKSLLDAQMMDLRVNELIRRFDIKTPTSNLSAQKLSGGNQQRVVIARELSANPDLLIAVNPTRGLDIGATEYVHRTLYEERDKGKAILLTSTELDEVLTLSDRVAVIFNGTLKDASEYRSDRRMLGLLMTGAEKNKE